MELILGIIYALYVGFFVYAAASSAWNRMLIGHKVLIAPVLLLFGLVDVLFNVTLGALMFWEEPLPQTGMWWYQRDWTFSQRCCRWYRASGWRGSLAGAWSVPLNAVYPKHIH